MTSLFVFSNCFKGALNICCSCNHEGQEAAKVGHVSPIHLWQENLLYFWICGFPVMTLDIFWKKIQQLNNNQ